MINFFTKKHPFYLLIFLATIEVHAQSDAGVISGAASVCPNSTNSGFLSVSGYNGTILNWQSTTDGFTWINTGNTIATQSYFNVSQTTCYRVIVQDATFPPDTSPIACIAVYAPSVAGTISGGGSFCNQAELDTLMLTGNVGKVLYWQVSINGGSSWTNVPDTLNSLIYPIITQNTIYRVIVQNGSTCPKDTSSTVSFIIYPPTDTGTISGSDTVCYGANSGTLVLSENVGSVISWLYSTNGGAIWNPLSNTTSIQGYSALTQTRWYTAVVKSGVCDADTSYPAVIKVLAQSPVSAGVDTSVLEGKSVLLNGSGTGIPTWSPSSGLSNENIFAPLASPALTTNYILSVSDSNGCINTDAVLITVISSEFAGMVSNFFTPNGDGINDTWYIQDIENYPENEVFIYNIYGNKVYEKKGYANDWAGTYNGSDLPDGTYYFVLKIEDSKHVIKGSIDLLRNK